MTMFFSLDVLRAHKGDCLMLHYGTKDAPHLILIDGGPSDVYKPQMKPRLTRIHGARGIEEGEPLPVDVVMVSHVDDDHIQGILELTKEQRTNKPFIHLDVSSLWHNSFDDLLTTKPAELVAGFGAASVDDGGGAGGSKANAGSALASIGDQGLAGDIDVDTKDEVQALEVLASIPQGRQLRDDAVALKWTPNKQFDRKLILATAAQKPVMLNDLKVTVVGPMQPELMALQVEHDKFLKAQQAGDKKTPEAALASFVDASVPNLSSVVVLVETGGKSILFTGDARGDKILEGLELSGRLKKGDNNTMHIDILKVPHHGSDNNMETIFFKRVTADHYVFSGNGENGNPERNTMAMLLEARGTDANYTIHLTYPVDEIDIARKADWTKQQTTEKKRKKKVIRPDWSQETNSLTEFFKANPKFAQKIKIVDAKEPHLIDLLDAVKI
jgi:beta-lactamase superfamily II metal-dependent hydrolase